MYKFQLKYKNKLVNYNKPTKTTCSNSKITSKHTWTFSRENYQNIFLKEEKEDSSLMLENY